MFKIRFLLISILLLTVYNFPLEKEASAFNKHDKVVETQQMDRRAQILSDYLAQYNSPLQYNAQDFIEAADLYGVDWKLVPSIAGVESTFGKAVPGGNDPNYSSYNAWGWGVYGDQTLRFQSFRTGIFVVTAGLKRNYIDKGLNDPFAINRIYASSPYWGTRVSSFMQELEKFSHQYEHVNPQQSAGYVAKISGSSAQLSIK